jgi:two-component system chemotaxis sensor kinase CheA
VAQDPYRYFRIEAKDLVDGLSQGLLELEKGGWDPGPVADLLRLAHTLKGAARIVRHTQIADLAHGFEGACLPYRDGKKTFTQDSSENLFQQVDRMAEALKILEGPPADDHPASPKTPAEEAFDSIRIPIHEIDSLLDGISEAAISLDALRGSLMDLQSALGAFGSMSALGPPAEGGAALPGQTLAVVTRLKTGLQEVHRNLALHTERVGRELSQARESSRRMRLLPVSTLFTALERAVRDAARTLGKEVRFEAAGGEHRGDAQVLRGVQHALLHLVRNAVAHGAEAPAERTAAGKRPATLVRVSVERRGDCLAFLCSDDGRGFDLENIQKIAVRRRLISPSEASGLDLDRALQLILHNGLSTTETADEISGRGLGLDAVGALIAKLKGKIRAYGASGRGATFEIVVPVSLTSLSVLQVKAGGETTAFPLEAVVSTLRVASGDLVGSPQGVSIPFEGRAVPFLPLARLLDRPVRASSAWSAVVIQSKPTPVALGVDRILGTVEVVIKPLPALVGPLLGVAGASFDAEGNPQLVLDPAGLARKLSLQRGGPPPMDAGAPPRVLVVDDSLTTRMLEQSILESAGYEVELATSGEEGLQKARQERFRVMLVDVEMPGMDGFEFLEHAGSDAALREVPCILVTSRDSAEDKRRGEALGARAYIVKSEFDESRFLKKIESLVR